MQRIGCNRDADLTARNTISAIHDPSLRSTPTAEAPFSLSSLSGAAVRANKYVHGLTSIACFESFHVPPPAPE